MYCLIYFKFYLFYLQALSSQENLKETLHGNEKQSSDYTDDDVNDAPLNSASNIVDQAEFDRVQKDTTDFCDVQVAYSQHSNPTFDDEGIDEELYERLKNKERDPMSMSFYQEKDEDTCETGHNPFDLNAVQTLPNDSFEEYKDDQPQPDNSLYGINPFAGAQPDVTTNEINAAISHIDNVVTHEGDLFDSTEFIKPESPAKVEAELPEHFENIVSPVSDNISQLTEPSEQENVLEPAVEAEVMFKQEEDLCLMPKKMEENLIDAFDSKVESQVVPSETNELDFQSNEPDFRSPDLIGEAPYIAICPMYPPPNLQPTDPIGFEQEEFAPSPEPAVQSPEPKGELLEPFVPSPEPIGLSPEVPDYQSEPLTHPLSPQPQSPFHNATSPFPETQSPVLEADFVQECSLPIAKSPLPETESVVPESKSPILDCHSPQPDIIPSSFSEFSDNVCNIASNMLQQASDMLVPENLTTEHIETNNMALSDMMEIKEPIIEPKQIESNLSTQIENQTCEIVESNVVEDILKNTGEFLTDEICKPIPNSEPIEKSFSPFSNLGYEEISAASPNNLIDDFSRPMTKELNSDSFHIDQPVVESEPIVDSLISQPIEQNIVNDLLVKNEEQAIPDLEQNESKNTIDLVTPLEIAAVTGVAAAATAAAVATVGGVIVATPTEDKKSKPKSATSVTKKTTTTKSAVSPTKPTTSPIKSATSPTKTVASPTKSATSPTKSAISPTKAATPRVPAAKKPTTPITKAPIASKAPAAIKPKTSTTLTSPTKPAPKPIGASTAAPKPKPAITTTRTTSTVERKPLTNGDVKKDVVKKTSTTTVKTTTSAKPAGSAGTVSKTSTTTTRVSLTGTARPTTAPARTVTAARPSAPKPATAAPKARPAPTPATRCVFFLNFIF